MKRKTGANGQQDALLAAVGLAVALAWTTARAADDPGLLFHVSGQHGATADVAAGIGEPLFVAGVDTITDGASGAALALKDSVTLAWSAPGNIYARHGTLAFFFRARQPLGATAFPIMRVGASESSAWDMTWLRIDWNGHGFDAFVTDTSLARSRVSFTVPTVPRPDQWVHLAFGWDEASGVRLWVDGRPAARKDILANYDASLFGIGPFQRIVGPWQVQSSYNFTRSGDIDELRIYDRLLDDRAVAAVKAGTPVVAPASADAGPDAAWQRRFGWNRPGDVPPYLADPVTRIRKVAFTDTRDVKAKMFRGADGIRETTWPGVYNRSRLPGRDDYFQLPDWNTYSTGGLSYVLSVANEPWNRVEINGAAHGLLVRADGDGVGTLARRPADQARTTTQLPTTRMGGVLRFDNDEAETPIEEIAAYHVAAGTVPKGLVTLSYTVDAGASLAPYANLDTLRGFIDGRHVAAERATVAALPAGAPRRAAAPTAATLPIVHVLIPGDFRSPRRGTPPTRFSYGWQNLDGGLDGIALDLPALKVAATHGGLLPLNIRIKDPLWPERDLLDVNVSVKPGEARTLWLDTRDRLLPPTGNVYLTIAAAGGGFGAASLDGMRVRLVFKPAAEAKAEHIADRLEQARDNLSFLVEENPNIRPYPMWHRFELDVSDVLRIDPANAFARAMWVEKNPEQPHGPFVQATPPAGVPLWAFRQVEMLKLYRRFINWWIDERQVDNGEFGGGLSDDTDLTNLWVPLTLMGVQPERNIASQRKVLDATYANGMWTDGFPRILTDELHVYEEGINAVAQSLQMRWGDPTAVERAMQIARNYPRILQANPAGHVHIASSYFSGANVVHEQPWASQRVHGFLVNHPGLQLVDWNGAPATRALMLGLMDGYLAHGRQDASGKWTFPSNIDWRSDQASGSGVGAATYVFRAAHAWTGDAKYLRPFQGAATSADAGPIADQDVVAGMFARELQANTQRFPVMTEGHLWVDRVSVATETLQRTRLGGIAHQRNAFYPDNLVSWRFAGGASGEDVALLIPSGDARRFTVIAWNLSGKTVRAQMTGAQVAAGEWTVSGGADADQRTGGLQNQRSVQLERGGSVELDFAPGQSVFEFTLVRPGDDPATRADIGISPDDLKPAGAMLGVRVHSLGAKPTPPGTAFLEDSTGKTLASARFPALEAPLDLLPRTAETRIALPKGADPATLRVRLALDGAPGEITKANNIAPLLRPTLETDRVR